MSGSPRSLPRRPRAQETLPYAFISEWPSCCTDIADQGLDSLTSFHCALLARVSKDAHLIAQMCWTLREKGQCRASRTSS